MRDLIPSSIWAIYDSNPKRGCMYNDHVQLWLHHTDTFSTHVQLHHNGYYITSLHKKREILHYLQ